MVKLIQLIEGRDAPLYHGTPLPNLFAILQDNALKGGKQYFRGRETPLFKGNRFPQGPRLSRNKNVASVIGGVSGHGTAILVMDQAKLAQRYKLVPYYDGVHTDDSRHRFNEYEEVVVTDQIQPLDKYLTAITVSKDSYEDALMNLHALDGHLKYDRFLSGYDFSTYEEWLKNLPNNPAVTVAG